ncbi:PAS domain-containing sensor histidine kinase [Mucilaginibacter flavus]|uniref:PAS domain-containing sensor histidine kinase n=1 Tax=Mucilaginibacter flavus TaxID=931504 RepID=UPI0025B4F9F9|nr:PAS domain-containing sensor histidine kinase [Mucilaginibacter flavus]MDN3584627.1 PAS domain-containing sensor histidine kinase [Mucilaginibacter flavus]
MRYPNGKRLLELVFKTDYFSDYIKKQKFYNRYMLPFVLTGLGLCFLIFHQRDRIDPASFFVFTTVVSLGLCGFLLFKLFHEKNSKRRFKDNLDVLQSRLGNIYDSGIIGLLYTRYDGVITDANDMFLNIIGYSRADLEQGLINWVEMTPPEYSEKNKTALNQLTTTGFCEPFEKEYFRKDGSRVAVMLGSALLHQGDSAEIITYAVDITGLKEAEKKEKSLITRMHHRQEELFRILKEAPVAVVIRKGLDMELEYANQTALNYAGFSHQKVTGASEDHFDAKLMINYDHVELKRVFLTGKPVTGKAKPVAYDRNGTGVMTHGWFDYVREPIFDENGTVSGVVTFTFDVTELVRANRELEKNEYRFRFIADAIPHKMWTSAPDGSATYYNKGWSDYLQENDFDKLRSKAWAAVHPDELEDVKRAWQEMVDNGSDMEIEQRLRRHDGVYEWHLTRVCSCWDENSVLTMYVGSSTNIHEQKMAQIAMRIAMEKKDEFFSIAAHELRTPITSMKAALQALEKSVQIGSEIKKTIPVLKMANKQVNRLIGIVNDLLDVDQIQSGKLNLNKTLYELSDSVKEVVAQLKFHHSGHTFIIEAGQDNFVEADKARIENVLVNLLTNAVKYSPEKGNIRILLKKNNSGVMCSVIDNGIGIPTDLQPYVFDRFFRVHASSQFFSGLGLGLYISAETVRRHGGNIGVESKEKEGSVFWFTLPEPEILK